MEGPPTLKTSVLSGFSLKPFNCIHSVLLPWKYFHTDWSIRELWWKVTFPSSVMQWYNEARVEALGLSGLKPWDFLSSMDYGIIFHSPDFLSSLSLSTVVPVVGKEMDFSKDSIPIVMQSIGGLFDLQWAIKSHWFHKRSASHLLIWITLVACVFGFF